MSMVDSPVGKVPKVPRLHLTAARPAAFNSGRILNGWVISDVDWTVKILDFDETIIH